MYYQQYYQHSYQLAPSHIRDKPAVHEWVDARMSEVRLIQLATPRNIISAALAPSPIAHGDIVGIYLHADPSTITWARVCDLPHQLISYDELWLDTGRHPHDTGSKVIIHHAHIIVKASLWIESARQYDEYLGGEPDDDAPVTTKISVQGLETSVYPTDAGWFIDGQEPRDGNDAPFDGGAGAKGHDGYLCAGADLDGAALANASPLYRHCAPARPPAVK